MHSKRKTRQNKALQLIVSKSKKLGTKPAIERALMICHLDLQMFPMREESKKPFLFKTQGSSDKGMSYVHSFGYFYLKLSKPLGSIRFYVKGNLHPIKFQRTELLISPHLNPNESDFTKKNFHNRDKVS